MRWRPGSSRWQRRRVQASCQDRQQRWLPQKLVDIRVHWAMPVGVALIRSRVVPPSYQATGVGSTAEVRCVQDYSLFEWPSIDFQYAASTYAMTTMAHYAPFLQGVITGIGAS